MRKLQVTSYKLQVLTLVLFLGLLLTSHFSLLTSIYAQSPTSNLAGASPNISKTQQRLNGLEKLLSNVSRFNKLTGDKEERTIASYAGFLSRAVENGRMCYSGKDSQTKQQRKDCDNEILNHYKKAKQYYRLLKYYQVEQKTPFICVKADLGISKPLEAKGISNPAAFASPSPGSKETGLTKMSQVFLCTGEAGQKKLRVQATNGRYVKLTPQDLARADLQLTNLPPAGNLNQLEEKLGVDQ